MAINPDPTAVMGRRVGAAVIDGLIVFAPAVAIISSNLQSYDYASDEIATDSCTQYQDEHESGVCATAGHTMYFTDSANAAPLYLLGFSLVMFVVLQGLTGWSLGKLMTGLRVVQADGRAIGLPRAALRWLLWIVDSLPFLWLVGLITSFTTVGHRRVGDMVAKSYVVRADAAGRPVEVPGHTVAPGAPVSYGTPTWAAASTAPTAKPGPQWDEARGTYIQWDPEAQDWMRWDDAAKRWDPISATEPAITSPPPPPAPPAPPAAPSQPAPPPPPADPAVPPAPPAPPQDPPAPPAPPLA